MTTRARDPVVLPSGLRDRVLAASLRARAAGSAVPDVPAIPADEAFRRAAGALSVLLGELTDQDWRAPALRGLDVQGLVGHLIGVEHDVHRCLAGDPAVAEASHIDSTQPAADRQAGRTPAQTRSDWRRAADRTLALARGVAPEASVALHGMRLPASALLVVRAFELWAHENDIRSATGRPPSAPDPPTLRLMTELAARSLPTGAARTGLREPISARLVLTGPGGGTWDVRLGDGPRPAPVRIVCDAVEFCRLVANRAFPADLDLEVTGAPDPAAAVLAAAAALALD